MQLDDVDLRRETGDGWSSTSTSKQVPKSVQHRTTCNFQKSNGTSLRLPNPTQTFASARYHSGLDPEAYSKISADLYQVNAD